MRFNRTLKTRQLHKNGEWTHNALYNSRNSRCIVLCVRIASSARWSCEVFREINGEQELIGRFYVHTLTDRTINIYANQILKGNNPKGISSRIVRAA